MLEPILVSAKEKLTIAWERVKEDGLTGYKIEWTDGVQDDPITETVESHLMMFHILNIDSSHSYSIRIAALNTCGQGAYSHPLTVKSTVCLPRLPAPHVTTLRNSNDVVITWE
jgi:hypothetical protein